MTALAGWIRARQAEGIAFTVLGDFNRHMDGTDQFWRALERTAPLTRATEGHVQPMLGRRGVHRPHHPGGRGARLAEPDTLRVLTYRETGAEWKARLSDHCPVSVRLRVPDRAR